MHDETFLVTEGVIRFHAADGVYHDAHLNDYVTVPIRAPHTFSNPTDKKSRVFITFTPAFYIDYFKILAELSKSDSKMSKEKNLEVSNTAPSKHWLSSWCATSCCSIFWGSCA